MKRSKVELPDTPSLVTSTANRGRLRDPPKIISSNPAVDIYPSQNNYATGQSKTARYRDDKDEDQAFNDYFYSNELSATVLCCDYPNCRSMGALQKDYLKDHYITYHNESLIKPSVMIPPATSGAYTRSLRCSACLRKLTDANQGRTCDNCQSFERMRNVAMLDLPDLKGLQGMTMIFIIKTHTLS